MVAGRRATPGKVRANGWRLPGIAEEGAREFRQLCPQCKYVNVPDAAHMVAGDRNDIFGNAVIAFLSRAVTVGRAPAHPPHELHPHQEGPAGEVQDIP